MAKPNPVRKLKNKWEQKKLLGQYRVNVSNIDKKSTDSWLRVGKLIRVETEAFITAAPDQALWTHNYDKVKSPPRWHVLILAKHEYLERHNKICREYGLDGLTKEWYDHIPNPVTTGSPCMILYDQQIHTDRTVCQLTNRISS